MSKPEYPTEYVAANAEAFYATGTRILQGYRMHPVDSMHVQYLLNDLQPPPNATIADLGCGYGEVARLMHKLAPDLNFMLVNNIPEQMAFAPTGPHFTPVISDMHKTPILDASVDCVLMHYSFCHADQPAVLREAARMLQRGGRLQIFDYITTQPNAEIVDDLASVFLPDWQLYGMLQKAGFTEIMSHVPSGSDATWRALYQSEALYEHTFRNLKPVIFNARRA